jgi:hypothetical protein
MKQFRLLRVYIKNDFNSVLSPYVNITLRIGFTLQCTLCLCHMDSGRFVHERKLYGRNVNILFVILRKLIDVWIALKIEISVKCF